MKMIRIYSKLFVVFLFLISGSLEAQIFVTPANVGSKSSDAAGFYYALPRNAVRIDLIIEKKERFKGPYSEFSSKILGIDDFVKQDETIYSIIDVIITGITEPDPNAWFFVEFDERGSKDARSLVFDLQANGIIMSADDSQQTRTKGQNSIEKTFVNAPAENRFHYFAERNLYQRIDTIVRKITIDTTVIRRNILQSAWVDRNPEQKARAAADFIHKIRDNRFNLITGFQEVNYGQSIIYMDQKLQNLEEEYLSLFLGKEVRSIVEQTVYYYPDKESKGIQNIAKFSETAGLLENSAKGENFQLVFEPLLITSILNEDNKTVGKSRLSNSLYYRIPDAADVSVMYKGKILGKERLSFSQLGVLSITPISKTRVVFDPNTGFVTTVKRE